MCDKRVGFRSIFINNLTHLSAGIPVEEAKRHLHDFSHSRTSHIGFYPERR